MKRKAFLFIFLIFAAAVVFAAMGRKAEASFGASPEGVILENLEIRGDEETDRVESSLILVNSSKEVWEAEIALPLLSGGFAPGSLVLWASEPFLRTGEDRLRLHLEPGGSLRLQYSYQPAQPLDRRRVIGLDLEQPLLKELPVNRLYFSLSLREEDLPLVKEIAPANWVLEGQSISIELFQPSPGPLLNRIYVEKETMRDLKGSREREIAESQRLVMKYYRDWLKHVKALPIETPISQVFLLMCGREDLVDSPEGHALFYAGLGSYNGYRSLLDYCILKQALREDLSGSQRSALADSMYFYDMWPVNRELLRRITRTEPLYHLAVSYELNQSLAGADLYRKEMEYLLARPGGIAFGEWPEDLFFRVSVIGPDTPRDQESLKAFLETVGAEMLVRQKILDNRRGTLYEKPADEYGSIRSISHVYGTDGLDLEQLKAFVEAAWHIAYRRPPIIKNPPLKELLPIPSLIHYTGEVATSPPDGRYYYHYYDLGHYRAYMAGLEFYRRILTSPDIEEQNRIYRESLEKERQELRDRIRLLEETLPLVSERLREKALRLQWQIQ